MTEDVTQDQFLTESRKEYGSPLFHVTVGSVNI